MTELELATIARRAEFDRITGSIEPSVEITLHPGAVDVRVRERSGSKLTADLRV
ncbi:hypothetical protein [Halosolutus halophilus]|uniref:hypothetical protein n=1 Tax=Halosolutus halophilus TaxID=1552990 RepID=UPI002235191E|nr:hypothetical protein [Halosolutus halophilus]